MRGGAVVAVVALVGCGRLGFDAVDRDGRDAGSDAGSDAPPDVCTLGPWSAPIHLASLASPEDDWSPALAPDGLTLYFERKPLSGGSELLVATRPSPADPFGPPMPLTQLNSTANDRAPAFTADGLTLYFASARTGGDHRLYRATRASTADPFGAPSIVSELSTVEVWGPVITADGRELFFCDFPTSLPRLLRAEISAGTIGAPQPILELDAPGQGEGFPTVSPDGLELYFVVTPTGSTDSQIVVARRADRGAPFGAPVPVAELNSVATSDDDPSLAFDGRTMLLASTRAPAQRTDLFLSTRDCL